MFGQRTFAGVDRTMDSFSVILTCVIIFYICFDRLNCSSSDIGLLNPTVNPDDYREIHCPCDSGAPSCPANNSQGELLRYRSVTFDEFYDLSGKNISTWILRTYDELKDKRFVYSISFTSCPISFCECPMEGGHLLINSHTRCVVYVSVSLLFHLCMYNCRFGGFEFGIHNMSRFADFSQQFANVNDESSISFQNILSKPDILSAWSNSKGITDDLTKNNVKVPIVIITFN